MKYLGKIFKFIESKGYGFIWTPDFKFNEGENGIFFHYSDCQFSPIQANEWVSFELKKYNGKIKAANIQQVNIIEDIDYLFSNWDTYSAPTQDWIISGLQDCYIKGLNLMDNQVVYEENYEHLINSEGRLKLISIAKSYIANNKNYSGDEKLYKFFSSILESELISEFEFVRDCKNIIDEVVDKEFSRYYIDLKAEIDKIPSRNELLPVVVSYLQNLKPSIKCTYTHEDGHWAPYWKWDGSEEIYVDPKSWESIEYSQIEDFTYKEDIIDVNYYSYNNRTYFKDGVLCREDVALDVYSKYKNSRRLWELIKKTYNDKEEDILREPLDKIQKAVLSEIQQYLITAFPIYGATMYDWSEKRIENHSLSSVRADIDIFERFKLSTIRGVNVYRLMKQLLSIQAYLHESIVKFVNSNLTQTKLSVFDLDTIERNGMILSADNTTLYAVLNSNLQELIVPDYVTHIEDGAFDGCTRLRTVQFLGAITYVGHGVFIDNQFGVDGDFSNLSYLGFNTSEDNITINGETQSIKEWSRLYNKSLIDNTNITIKLVHIKHDD